MRYLIIALALLCVAVPSFGESPYIYGWHFWRDGANIDCGAGKAGWVVELDLSTNFQPDVDKFKRMADEGHTIIMRLDYDSGHTFPTNSADYWKFAARYAFWVEKLKDYCHIWLIGNEEAMNYDCFRQVRQAVHAIQPRAIFCAGAPHFQTQMLQNLTDYVDGVVQHTYSADFVGEMDTAIPSGKTKLAYITEFQSAPPNTNPLDFRMAFAGFNNWNQTHSHKLEAACKFVYYEFGSEYTALQMQPMQDADFNESTTTTAYTNSYAQPYIDISDISESGISETYSQIGWITDVGSTGQIEYWEDGEIGQHWSAFDGDESVTAHMASIGPLVPGRTYHYIIKCYRGGRPFTMSDVRTFVHQPPSSGTITGYVRSHSGAPIDKATVTRYPGGYSCTTDADGKFTIAGCSQGTYTLTCASSVSNTVTKTNVHVSASQETQADITVTPKVNYLTNPGFESGLAGWTIFADSVEIVNGSWFGGITAHSGSKFLGRPANWGAPKGGVYQLVTGLPAGTYTFSAFLRQYHGDNPYSETRDRIGIDPTGGTDPASANVRWSDWNYNFWHWQSEWRLFTTPSAYSAGNCTVFIQFDDQSNYGWHIHAFDDTALVSSALQTQTAATPASAKAYEDGVPVSLAGMIATTSKGALGTNVLYVENPARTSGIKVDMTGIATAVSEGNAVSVTGTMATGANGERYIAATSVTASSGTEVGPLGIVNKSIGGEDTGYEPGPPVIGQRGVRDGVGVNNVGMLIRTTGTVLSTGGGYVMISDGSPTPLKVDTTYVTNAPSAGQYVTVTGIASVEVSGSDLVPVLRPRRNADVQVESP
jgi:hypothetical protein